MSKFVDNISNSIVNCYIISLVILLPMFWTNKKRNWETYIEFASQFIYAGLTDDLRNEWIAALRFLQDELGPGFFKNCKKDHPFVLKIDNTSSGSIWSIKSLISIANTIAQLRNGVSYSKLLEKIHSAEKCRTEGLPFIEVSETYIRNEFLITFPNEIKDQKTPDIQICNIDTKEKFYIELSKLNDRDETLESGKSYDKFFRQFPLYDVYYCCNQIRNFSDRDLPQIITTIKSVRNRAIRQNCLAYYKDDNLELAISPFSKRYELEQWCEQYDKRIGLHGIPLDFNETKRIANNKIGRECKQIPIEYTGIIYIPVNQYYFLLLRNEDNFNGAVIAFQKELIPYTNVLGVVAYSSNILMDAKSYSIQRSEYIYSQEMIHDSILKQLLFVKNPAYNNLLSKNSIEKIYDSFL